MLNLLNLGGWLVVVAKEKAEKAKEKRLKMRYYLLEVATQKSNLTTPLTVSSVRSRLRKEPCFFGVGVGA